MSDQTPEPSVPTGDEGPAAPTPSNAPHGRQGSSNGLAIASLVVGIVGIVLSCLTPILGFVLGVLAIIFGAVAMNQIKSRGQQGRGLALTGLILGIVVAAWAIIAAIFLGGALLFNMDG